MDAERVARRRHFGLARPQYDRVEPRPGGVRVVEVGLGLDGAAVALLAADPAVVVDPVRQDVGPALADGRGLDPAERDDPEPRRGDPVRDDDEEPEHVRALALGPRAREVLADVELVDGPVLLELLRRLVGVAGVLDDVVGVGLLLAHGC